MQVYAVSDTRMVNRPCVLFLYISGLSQIICWELLNLEIEPLRYDNQRFKYTTLNPMKRMVLLIYSKKKGSVTNSWHMMFAVNLKSQGTKTKPIIGTRYWLQVTIGSLLNNKYWNSLYYITSTPSQLGVATSLLDRPTTTLYRRWGGNCYYRKRRVYCLIQK